MDPSHDPSGMGDHPGAEVHEQVSSLQTQQLIQRFWENQTKSMSQATDFKNHQLPLARIKKIMKADEEVQMISAEAPVIFAKACELFINELTLRSWMHTEENKRRTLQRNDIAMAVTKTGVFDFLIDIVPREDVHTKTKTDAMLQPEQVQQYYLQLQQAQLAHAASSQMPTGAASGPEGRQGIDPALMARMMQQGQQGLDPQQALMLYQQQRQDQGTSQGMGAGGMDMQQQQVAAQAAQVQVQTQNQIAQFYQQQQAAQQQLLLQQQLLQQAQLNPMRLQQWQQAMFNQQAQQQAMQMGAQDVHQQQMQQQMQFQPGGSNAQ